MSSNQLLLHFNGYTFNTLSGVLDHIWDFPEGVERVPLYLEIVRQASTIFGLSSAFSKGLIKAMKKDKSWSIANWTKQDVKELLAPIARHVRADQTGRNRREGALGTITKHWGPDVTGFFRSRDESEKCLRQIAHIACNYFSYSDARRYVNAVVVERLISGSSRHSGQYETTTTDWLALNNDMSRILEITHSWLVPVNVYYGSFGKLIEGPPHLEDFEALVVEGSSPAKVVKTSASSSPANSSSGRSFGFVKCPPRLKATQAPTSSFVKKPPPLIEIEGPAQLLVDGIICSLPFVVGSAGNGNGEQFQFYCIL